MEAVKRKAPMLATPLPAGDAFKDRLRWLMAVHGHTAKEVAERLCRSPGAVVKYARGETEPSIQTIRDLCDLYNVSADFLLGRIRDEGEIVIHRLRVKRRREIDEKKIAERRRKDAYTEG